MNRIAKISMPAAAFLVALASALSASPGRDDASAKRLPAKDRAVLRKALATAMDSIPGPPAMYVMRVEESRDAVDEVSPWDRTAKRWLGPGSATAERYYEVPEETTPEEQRELLGPIEMTVMVNRWQEIGDLGSVGAEPVLLPIPGAVAIEVSTIAPGESGGRISEMSPAQADHRLTELTLAIGDGDFQDFLRERLEKRSPTPLVRRPTKRPSRIEFIVIRLHGPKKPIEYFARRIPTASLRRLLSG